MERFLLVLTLAALSIFAVLGAKSEVRRFQAVESEAGGMLALWRLDTATGDVCLLEFSKFDGSIKEHGCTTQPQRTP